MAGLVDTAGRPLSTPSEQRIAVYVPFEQLLQEATQSVEQELALEDAGWITLGIASADVVTPAERIANLRASRLYYAKDPLGRQAIRLWTDYTFGRGMTFQAKDDKTQEVLETYWNAPQNASILKARGQRRSSDKLLVDGEIFFVVFLGTEGKATIRWIDPLEVREIITDPDDVETVLYYDRWWSDRQGRSHRTFYRSAANIEDQPTLSATGQFVSSKEGESQSDGIVFHLTYNTITQRGNPLLLPALDWIKQYRRFLAARVAFMLALTRFAWEMKVKGGQLAVDAQSGKLAVAGNPPEAGAVAASNEGVDLKPIKTDSAAKNAEADGRMLKLQVSAATGWPEQYFGDISTGNLATAKTVELPVLKMCQSLQQVWEDFYQEVDELVLDHNGIKPDKWYTDRDFPPIAPKDLEMLATAIDKIVKTFPQFADSMQVKKQGLVAIGVDDTDEVLEALEVVIASNPDAQLLRVLRDFERRIKVLGNGKGEV